jgi:hypothetical protein
MLLVSAATLMCSLLSSLTFWWMEHQVAQVLDAANLQQAQRTSLA